MLRLKEFLNYLKNERRYSPHTITAYANDIEQFFLFITRQYELEKEEDITPPLIKSWIYDCTREGMSARTINRKRVALGSYYKYLLRNGYVANNPFALIQSVKTEKRLFEWVPENDMERLFDEIPFGEDFQGLRDRVMLELLYGTGIRRAELISLQQADADLKEGTIKVTGKRNKERIIPIPSSLVLPLKQYIAAKAGAGFGNSGNLLVTDNGKAVYPMFVQRTVKRWLGAVSSLQKTSPHVLRHTYATHLLNNGAAIESIKELLGHASLAATQVYTHNSIERLKTIFKQAHPKGTGS